MQLLSKSEVDRKMSSLTKEQQEFLSESLKQSKKSKWLEVLARNKGINFREDISSEVLEQMIDDWVLIEILDSGFGQKNYRCKCGTHLRYQYVIHNKKNGETVGLGFKCFEHHTNLPFEVVRDIKMEFHKIDLMRDEILQKLEGHDYFDITPYLYIESLPKTLVEQVNLQLPLTNNQINRLERLKENYDFHLRTEKVLNRLTPNGREFLEGLPNREKVQLLTKMVNGDWVKALPEGFIDEEIQHYLSLGLPLLDRQIEKISQYNLQKKEMEVNKEYKEKREIFRLLRDTNPRPQRIRTVETTINYETLIERHFETLQQVRRKELELSRGMKNDWDRVQAMILQCKKGEELDYSSFKVNLSMICISVGIKGDLYL